MGRTNQSQALQEYEHDQHGVDEAPPYVDKNQPAEITSNYNIHQVSYTMSDPTELKANFAQDQYPPPQNQQPNPAPYPPQQNPPMDTPSPNYPPPGLPMQYPQTRSPEPVHFPPYHSQTSYGPPQYPQNPQMGNPMPTRFHQAGTQPWKTGLFDFMADPENTILTVVVPCLTFGQIAEIIDNGNTSCAAAGLKYALGIPCLVSYAYRTKLRRKFGLMETPAPDLVTHCLFEWCALCQEFRELKLRGVDPSIGWQGNLARGNLQQQQQQQMGMKPPTNQTMNY